MPASGGSDILIDTTDGQQREAERHQKTLQAARLLQSTLDLKELTAIILEIVRNEVPVDRVTAFVVDRKHSLLHSVVAQGIKEDTVISMPLSKGIAGFVAEHRQALDITDAYSDARFNPEFDERLQYHTKDIFALPVLNNEGDVVGVLELINRKEPIAADDVEFLQDISVFIGLALENAWLHAEVRKKAIIEEELARSREKLAQMERFSLMSEVLSTVARELTAPLSVVKKSAALLKQDPDATPSMLRHIMIMESAASSSTESIDSFLSFVQRTIGQRGKVDVRELVRETVAVRASHWASVGIEATYELGLTPITSGNCEELQHALLNVIRNAEDAMLGQDGPKTLWIRTGYDKALKLIRVDITDNGVGIATQHYERIFEPFFSTKRNLGRAGLGLTIANRLIREHRGEMLFETNPGSGTV